MYVCIEVCPHDFCTHAVYRKIVRSGDGHTVIHRLAAYRAIALHSFKAVGYPQLDVQVAPLIASLSPMMQTGRGYEAQSLFGEGSGCDIHRLMFVQVILQQDFHFTGSFDLRLVPEIIENV